MTPLTVRLGGIVLILFACALPFIVRGKKSSTPVHLLYAMIVILSLCAGIVVLVFSR